LILISMIQTTLEGKVGLAVLCLLEFGSDH
jgi:hypothetical protein